MIRTEEKGIDGGFVEAFSPAYPGHREERSTIPSIHPKLPCPVCTSAVLRAQKNGSVQINLARCMVAVRDRNDYYMK